MHEEMPREEKGPLFIDLFSEELERDLKSGRVYARKIEPIKRAEKVVEKVSLQTTLPDGTIEDEEEAEPGDWIITGGAGERFVETDEKFHDLYGPDGKGSYLPRGRRIIAIPNPFGQSIRISAPWGTPAKPAYQDGGNKAMLVAALAGDGSMTSDRYIIGSEALLLDNYVPVEELKKKQAVRPIERGHISSPDNPSQPLAA
jgi:hypothetical protein